MNDFLAASIKSVDDTGNGRFTAVASAPTVDRDGEVIVPGAMEPLPKSIPVHDGHPVGAQAGRQPIARARPYYKNGVLYVEGYFASTPDAQATRQKVMEGVLDSMSIMFHRPERETVKGVPTITKAELLAADFVGIPSNREARVISARAYGSTDERIERMRMKVLAAKAALAALDAREFLAELDRKPRTHADGLRVLAEGKALLAELNAQDRPSPGAAFYM
ncbi:MAG: hypothetical protein H0T78_01765 [Longispora sp.]|nr:hypothetical protein [Longispora sp. (in: high G+C Gram-positive bacteria)]